MKPRPRLYGGLPPYLDRLIVDIDGVLLNPSASFYAVGREVLSKEDVWLSDEDIAAFKWAGGFNDDWDLVRAVLGIHAYRRRTKDMRALTSFLRPDAGLPGVLELIGHSDPGDLSAQCERLYAQLEKKEVPLLPASVLQRFAATFPLYACTGRTRAQTLSAFEHFGVSPKAFISCEVAKKPSPQALLPLLENSSSALFVGDSWDDCLTCLNTRPLTSTRLCFFWCLPPDISPSASPSAVSQRLQRGGDGVCIGVEALLLRLLEGS